MKRITIIDGHPDSAERHLNHAFADCYAEAALAAGSEVRRVDIARLDFPLLRDPNEFVSGKPPKAIEEAQHDIAWANHLVLLYPMWIGDMPALLKAFLEQTFRPGFALGSGGERGFPKQLLKGKSARVIVTMAMPAFIYRLYFGAYSALNVKRSILGMCGIRPVSVSLFGAAFDVGKKRLDCWMRRIRRMAMRDSASAAKPRLFHAMAKTALFAGAAYLLYAGATWVRYGARKRLRKRDALLDAAMPEYEVSVHHGIAVNAPADMTFDAMQHADFQHSPIVRALLRTREVLMGASHVEVHLPHGLLDQLRSLGWTIVSERPGRELVLGTVTQPWKPSPTFRAMPAGEFERFAEPGYAKIALTLRVHSVTPERCAVYTETRVATTDALSRSRFRRYWAFLSPGIALIRVILLQQIKREAELRNAQSREGAGSGSGGILSSPSL